MHTPLAGIVRSASSAWMHAGMMLFGTGNWLMAAVTGRLARSVLSERLQEGQLHATMQEGGFFS